MTDIQYSNPDITIRPISPDDVAAVTAFANAIPPHDLLFLARDIRNDKVVSAWFEALSEGTINSLLALHGDTVVATTAIVRDPFGWSPHVADLRVLVSPDWRGKGLGRALVEGSVEAAAAKGASKIVAQMTADQRGAITLFEECGFRAEALLRDHVRDIDDGLHDLVQLALNVEQAQAITGAYR